MIFPSCFLRPLHILANQHAILDHYNIYFIATAILPSLYPGCTFVFSESKGYMICSPFVIKDASPST
jgi:hypothetical protein